MLETLKEIDTQWFLWINSHHTTALDWTMWTLSQHWSWAVVLALAIIPLVFYTGTEKNYRKIYLERQWWMVIVGVGLCFFLADQGSVHLFKEQFHRLRPCHAIESVRMFKTSCGGQYGFVSSHAANAWAVTTFLICCMAKKMKNKWPIILLLIWAILTCYSRSYLGKHYPGDLICGALFGTIIGLIIYMLCHCFKNNYNKRNKIGKNTFI